MNNFLIVTFVKLQILKNKRNLFAHWQYLLKSPIYWDYTEYIIKSIHILKGWSLGFLIFPFAYHLEFMKISPYLLWGSNSHQNNSG